MKGIFWFCGNIPNRTPEDSTQLLALEVSLLITADNAVNKFIKGSINKDMIKKEKDPTMTFVKGSNCCKKYFDDVILLPDDYEK